MGQVRVVAASPGLAPFPVDGIVEEEDTCFVLSGGGSREVREPSDSLNRLSQQMLQARPAAPGSVVVRGRSPLRLLAIVHDLDKDPSWREEWIVRALERVFHESERRRLRAIALPLLGSRHGAYPRRRFMALLAAALTRHPPQTLSRVWLMTDTGAGPDLIALLRSSI